MQPLGPGDPQQLGPFRLLGRLGSGGMGHVYLGRGADGRTVAVKVLRLDLHAGQEAEFRRRFASEVSAARAVDEAFTARVLDADPNAEVPWLATTFIPGLTLGAAVERRGPLPEGTLRHLARGLVVALRGIHAAGLVHRDLKPSNVMLAVEGPRVIDFGVSLVPDASRLTRSGHAVGTLGFMAPEQLEGAYGPASDVFAYGAVVAFAATGRPPFGRGTFAEVLGNMTLREPDLTGLPTAYRGLVSACLAKRPEDRPPVGALLDGIPNSGAHAVDPPRAELDARWLPTELAHDILAIAVQALDAARDTGIHQIPVQAGPPPRPAELPATVGRADRTDHAVPGRPAGHATPPPPGFPPDPHTRPAVGPRSPARGPSRRQALLGVGGVLLAAGAGAAVWAAVRDSSSPGAQPSSPPASGPPKPERQLWAFSAQGPIVSPPVLAGQRVLFGSADGPLHAVNLLDPTQSWTFPAPGGRVQRWNITAVENTAYVNGGDTTVHALDAGSGEEQAAYALDGVPGPVVGNAQSALYVGTGNGTLYCLDRRQSDVRSATYWDWTWKSGIPLGEPSVWDTGRGLVVAVGAQDRSLHLIAATAFTDNSGREYHQGSRLRQSQDAGRLSRPIWWGRRVLYGVGTTVVWGLDVDSTTVIGVDTKGPVVTVLAALDDVVLVDNGAGKLRCISYPQGRELWSADVGGTVLGCAAADGWVIARTDDTLHVLPLTGPPGWSFEARGTTLSTAIVKLPMVYFGTGDGNVYAFDVGGEGKPLWTYPAGAPVTQPLQLGDGILFAGTDAGVLHAVTPR